MKWMLIPGSLQAIAFFFTLECLGNGLSILVMLPGFPQGGLVGLMMLPVFGIVSGLFIGASYAAAAIATALSSFFIRKFRRPRVSLPIPLILDVIFVGLSCLSFAIASHFLENPMKLPPKGPVPDWIVYVALTLGALINAALAKLVLRPNKALQPKRLVSDDKI